MRTKGQTSIHLLLASIVTLVGIMLIMLTLAMEWEPWMVPVILIGNTLVWVLHITRTGSGIFYENLCAGLLMVGFFFFGVHEAILFDIPAFACMLIFVFSMFDKKRLLYMIGFLHLLVLLYHVFLLHTITGDMNPQDMIRLGVGNSIVVGAMAIAIYRIKHRIISRMKYDQTLIQLEKSGKQNAEFLSNVSHELRTPINMVLGISEVILERDISTEVRTDIESIKLAGKRLSSQINNMLDYTEIVEGTLIPAKEPYIITSIFNDIITLISMQGSKHKLEMVFDLAPGVPAVLLGDAEKISHVLKIILENSIKFTEEGGIYVYVDFRRESYGANLIIDICDTGIGMTDDQITQVCDDFYQADSGSSRFAGGLGLGIPIARGLLQAMGGFVHFESNEQQGLQVHITIPQGVEDDSPVIVLNDPKQFCIVCYFHPEKYSCDEVRSYYDHMILHMVEGLGIEGYQVHNFEGLLKIQNNHNLTHVFIAQAEYLENQVYYEELAKTLKVIVIAERDFMLNRNSRLMIIHKPFFILSIVNLLNGEAKENGFGEAQAAGRKPFLCDNVRALAVDDEEMNLRVAKGVLGSYGIQVDTCLNGMEAVERCTSTTYDIVFLDHMMPGFDGIETLKQIREINNGVYQDIPVVALTANTISGAREMFKHEGFTEFIPKPIERTVLERVLRKVLPGGQIEYDKMPVLSEDLPENIKGKLPEEYSLEEDTVQNFESKKKMPIKNRVKKNSLRKKAQEKYKTEDINGNKAESAKAEPGKTSQNKEDSVKALLEKVSQNKAESIKAEQEKASQNKAESVKAVPERESLNKADSVKHVSKKDTAVQEVPEKYIADRAGDANSHYKLLTRIGINVSLGLEYCCGEDDFYMEMLSMFCSQAAEKKAEIVSLYEAENWADYAVKVHALKSTSLTIGAERLAKRAKLLEQSGKREDTEYIRHNHHKLLDLYDEVCATIKQILDGTQ